MMNDNKSANNKRKNVPQWIRNFRGNLLREIELSGMNIKEFSVYSGISLSTLASFLYGKNSDMKLSSAIRISQSLGICLDILIGANTMSEHHVKLLENYDGLSESGKCLIMWYSEHLKTIKDNQYGNESRVCIMEMELKGGYMVLTRNCRTITLNEKYHLYNGKIFFGLTIPCDYYMPHYCKDEIVLVANDRNPNYNEHCIVRIGEAIYFARRKAVGGKVQYSSIRDGRFRVEEEYIDELIGYVVDTIDYSQIRGIV